MNTTVSQQCEMMGDILISVISQAVLICAKNLPPLQYPPHSLLYLSTIRACCWDIGIHGFGLLMLLFGETQESVVFVAEVRDHQATFLGLRQESQSFLLSPTSRSTPRYCCKWIRCDKSPQAPSSVIAFVSDSRGLVTAG